MWYSRYVLKKIANSLILKSIIFWFAIIPVVYEILSNIRFNFAYVIYTQKTPSEIRMLHEGATILDYVFFLLLFLIPFFIVYLTIFFPKKSTYYKFDWMKISLFLLFLYFFLYLDDFIQSCTMQSSAVFSSVQNLAVNQDCSKNSINTFLLKQPFLYFVISTVYTLVIPLVSYTLSLFVASKISKNKKKAM